MYELRNCTNLGENHGGDLLWGEDLVLSEVLNLNHWGSILINDLEWPRLGVLLDGWVVRATSDKTPVVLLDSDLRELVKSHCDRLNHLLDVEDSVAWVHGSLVLGRLTDQTLLVGEGNERWSGERTLLVGNDLNGSTLIDGNARVGGSEIDADGTIVNFVSHFEICVGG